LELCRRELQCLGHDAAIIGAQTNLGGEHREVVVEAGAKESTGQLRAGEAVVAHPLRPCGGRHQPLELIGGRRPGNLDQRRVVVVTGDAGHGADL